MRLYVRCLWVNKIALFGCIMSVVHLIVYINPALFGSFQIEYMLVYLTSGLGTAIFGATGFGIETLKGYKRAFSLFEDNKEHLVPYYGAYCVRKGIALARKDWEREQSKTHAVA